MALPSIYHMPGTVFHVSMYGSVTRNYGVPQRLVYEGLTLKAAMFRGDRVIHGFITHESTAEQRRWVSGV